MIADEYLAGLLTAEERRDGEIINQIGHQIIEMLVKLKSDSLAFAVLGAVCSHCLEEAVKSTAQPLAENWIRVLLSCYIQSIKRFGDPAAVGDPQSPILDTVH